MGQQRAFSRVDGNTMSPFFYKERGITLQMLPLAKQGNREVTGLQCSTNHFGAFGNKQSLWTISSLTKLMLGEEGVGHNCRVVSACDFNDGHGRLLMVRRKQIANRGRLS